MSDGIDKVVERAYDAAEKNKNIRWKFGAEVRQPTKNEIKNMISRMDQETEAGDQIVSGGLVFEKTQDHTDVYVWIGEL